MMYNWQIQINISECSADLLDHQADYVLLARIEHRFSAPTPPLETHKYTLLNRHPLVLNFNNSSPTLTSNKVQIMLVMKQQSSKDQIIAMATIPIYYTQQHTLISLTHHPFEKGLSANAFLNGQINIHREGPFKNENQHSPRKKSNTGSPYQLLDQLVNTPKLDKKQNSNLSRTSFQESDAIDKIKQQLEAVTTERDDLYKMSQDLYHELKKCMAQRDQYLQQLRQHLLSQQQTKQELEFLKLKFNQHEAELSHSRQNAQESTTNSAEDPQKLKDQNERLVHELQTMKRQAVELERRVRQSLKAMQQFKKEALEARSQLINKESSFSVASRSYTNFQTQDCIYQLCKQLQNRKNQEPPYIVKQNFREQLWQGGILTDKIKIQLAGLFARLLGRVPAKDKQWLKKQKVTIDNKLESMLEQFLRQETVDSY